MTVELVIFDCDGVLIDSEIIASRIHAEELTRIGYTVTQDQVMDRFTGKHGREIEAMIHTDLGHPLPVDYFDRTNRLMDIAYANDLTSMAGLKAVLAQITARFCVASNTRTERLRAALRLVELEAIFEPHIFSASMVANGKPAPDLFLYAARMMGVAPEACLVIEDSVSGIRAAHAANMRVFGFTGGSHCRPGHGDKLMREGAALVFDRMAALPDLAGL